ncbi:FAD-dependent oxidoreductase [Oscillatoria sp. CS-180]|uniref:NAD(P)/FAD-dependent oxidoreductase n=1 Tax=Oscillatoria sp. CS-180 TaxID=3021720 RepID=UPI00232E03A3|nr:FAD-dependent oxidoreductase [Oscillatoria sp. CS-180]MDB9526613.1 FAD-dependent oxidoreductase [Oscillatoria sp. CS-180]
MTQVVLVGCGVVGATLAYELSQHDNLSITILDKQSPAQGATGAALGIAMGVISHKVKGRNWRLREASLRRYTTLLPELEAAVGRPVIHNKQGILSLCFDEAELPRWRSLQEIRQRQGWPLEIWSPQHISDACPHIAADQAVAGIYSPQDLQIAPKSLTYILLEAAQRRGVQVQTNALVTGFEHEGDRISAVQTQEGRYPVDWVILTAGLGSELLTQQLGVRLPLVPVLGQGIRVKVESPLGNTDFQPVINGNDIHLVPLTNGEYGIAATVEFPTAGETTPLPQEAALAAVWNGAMAYCPALEAAEVLETWYGLRPRPQGQAAPVIQYLEGYVNAVLATGHYRNGVLLAPATAQRVMSLMFDSE